jgi:GAF domain-containing protein
MMLPNGLGGWEDQALLMHVPNSPDHRPDARFQLLLSVAQSIASCRELEELFRRLVGQLQSVVSFDFSASWSTGPSASRADPRPRDHQHGARATAGEANRRHPRRLGDRVTATADRRRHRSRNTLARRDGRDPPARYRELLQPAIDDRAPTDRTLAFGRHEHAAYAAADVEFMGEVARLVAVAVENALNFDDAQALQRQLSSERDHLRLLLDVTNALVSTLDLSGLIEMVSSSLQRAIPHEFTSLALREGRGRSPAIRGRSSRALATVGHADTDRRFPFGQALSAGYRRSMMRNCEHDSSVPTTRSVKQASARSGLCTADGGADHAQVTPTSAACGGLITPAAVA